MRFGPAILCVAYVATPAWAADQLAFGQRPDWVVPQTLSLDAPSASDSPVEALLFDRQVKLAPDAAAGYVHYALRINTAPGLAGASVAAEWDPAFDDITVHQVTIRRGAQRIDVLKGQKFAVLRREQNLEQQTLDGRLTATLQPDGLQVGDILEVEMTSVRRDPTLRGHMEVGTVLDLPTRSPLVQYRIVYPAKSKMRRRVYRGLGEPTMSRSGPDAIATWTLSPFVPVSPPRNAPPRFARGQSVDVTDFASWADLSMLLLPHFEQAAIIAANSPLQAEVARIRAASPDPARRAQLALELVQGKIRYVNLALGSAGLIPATTNVTWQRRYGDCKAKTVLLIGLLRALDIDANAVLVSSNGDGIDGRLPMIGLFDHVLVKAMIGGRAYWLDGTRTGDGRLDRIQVPEYRWGLPLARNAALERIMPGPLSEPAFETLVHTDASAGTDRAVPTTLTFIMRGDLAIAQNALMTSLDPTLRASAQREQLKSKLDRFEIAKVEGTFDRDALVYRLHGEGQQTLDISAESGTYWSEVPSLGYKADYRRTEGRDRDAPVAIPFPSFERNKQTIVLPRSEASRITFQMNPTSVTVAGVEYRRSVSNRGGVVTIDNHTRSLVPEIALAEAVAAETQLRKLDDDQIWLRLGRPRPSAQDVTKLLGKEARTSADYAAAAIKYLQQDQPLQAMAMLDRTLELDPVNETALHQRAQLRDMQGDSAGALADASKALSKHPLDPWMRRLHATLSYKAGNSATALADAKALEKIDRAPAQIARGHILGMLGRLPDAISAYRAALAVEDDPLTHLYIAAAMPAADKQGRRAALATAIALKPTDTASLSGLAQLALELGDAPGALTLLDQAFLKNPDDIRIRHLRAVAMSLADKSAAAQREFDALAARDLSAIELNNMCFAKAVANTALDRALKECDRSLALTDSMAARDSKGMVLLRLARWDDAVREYDAALVGGDLAIALFGRAIAYARKGDRARSDGDAARALKLDPSVERIVGHYGLTR